MPWPPELMAQLSREAKAMEFRGELPDPDICPFTAIPGRARSPGRRGGDTRRPSCLRPAPPDPTAPVPRAKDGSR